jgi:universal stress protein E
MREMKIDKVVVGTDFSEAAFETATWVANVFAPGAEVILVHASEPDRDRLLPEAPYMTSPAAAVHEAAVERTREIARLLEIPRVRVEVRDGSAHEVLRDVALDTGADLIAVAAHGEHSPASRLLGTTTDRLVRTTRIPVIVGGRKRRPSKGPIVVGIDASSVVPSVLSWTKYAADMLRADVTAVYALRASVHDYSLAAARGEMTREEAAEADAALEVRRESDWVHREATFAGIDDTRLTCEVVYGEAAASIREAAKRLDASLIILGRRDPIAVLPALLGRTLRRVLHEADCAVLIVTPSEDQIVDEFE